MASDLYTLNDPLFSDPFSLSPIDFHPSILENPFDETNNYANLPCFEVKTEDTQFYHSSVFGDQPFVSSDNFSFNFKVTCFDPLTEFTDFQLQNCENGYSNSGQIRRVCSTGDLQSMKTIETRHQLSWSPLGTKSSYVEEEANIKVGRYTAEERKQRILRYKAKRTQRNFNKTIKYACRKTLADNRVRVRGRFARNDEPGETSRAATSSCYEEEYDLWIDSCNFEEEEWKLFNILQPSQFK